ncbi:hypothetical protein Fcan01_20395 [Folsomia candida]|uniref:Uncharacterized protein n=2 Tax=Folsomia candida TaxID=158441 RepID=A0A226DG81_FOLCA|nr:hypothetical protein Fcan01_20395 [Folsomia candida]
MPRSIKINAAAAERKTKTARLTCKIVTNLSISRIWGALKMPLAPSKWRKPSKIVAIVDLILSTFSLLVTVLAVICLSLYGDEDMKREIAERRAKDPSTRDLDILWERVESDEVTKQQIFYGVVIFVELITILAAARFLGATSEGVEPVDAMKKTRCYRIMITIFLVFLLAILVRVDRAEQQFVTWGNFIFRCISVIVVAFYTKELDVALDALDAAGGQEIVGVEKEEDKL